MRRTPRRPRCGAALALLVPFALVAIAGCLPTDTRPVPATVRVTVAGTALIRDGIPADQVSDGWSISFDKFVVSLGNGELLDDPCTPYNDAGYRRLFDGKTLEPQKMSDLYGLGTCSLKFRSNNPDVDSILSTGVSEDDKTLMRTGATDAYNTNAGASVYVKGSATKGAVTKTFAWSFRHRVSYSDCTTGAGGPVVHLELTGDASLTAPLVLRGDALFRDRLDAATAKLRFGVFAEADDAHGNADGEVTLAELGAMTLAEAGVTAADETVGDAGTPTWTTFEDFVYLGLSPQVVGYSTAGTCTATIRQRTN